MRKGIGAGAVAALCVVWLAAAPGAARGDDERGFGLLSPEGAHLGVALGDIAAADVARLKLAEERGAVVREVVPDSPAAKAGLQKDDVILDYQGEKVQSAIQLARLVRETPPGRKVTLGISRNGAVQKLAATVEEDRGADLLSGRSFRFAVPPVRVPRLPDLHRGFGMRGFGWEGPRKLGIEYQEISGQLARYFHAPGEEAILVSSVDDGGPAARAGVEAGDLLLKIDGKPVRDAEALQEIVGALVPGKEATLTVQRNGAAREVRLKVGGEPAEPQEAAQI